MLNSVEMRAHVTEANRKVEEGSAILRNALEEYQGGLAQAKELYSEAREGYASLSEKLEESYGVLADAIEKLDEMARSAEERVQNRTNQGAYAVEHADGYASMV